MQEKSGKPWSFRHKKCPFYFQIFFQYVLSHVCRRFRRIALHIPKLWDIVSNAHTKDWITGIEERRRDPAIFIEYYMKRARRSISDLLQLTSPANRWKSLDVRFSQQKDIRDFLRRISDVSGGHLPSLQTLALRLDWDRFLDFEGDSDEEDDVGEEEQNTFTNLSEHDAILLSNWNLPKVHELTLENVIPSLLNCPALRTCHIELCGLQGTNHWSLHAFKNFLGCPSLRLVETLSFSFVNACSSAEFDTSSSKPIELPYLKSFTLKVGASTEERFLRTVLDMANMPVSVVTDLTVSISPFSVYDSILPNKRAESWIGAIFFLESIRRRPRSFMNVEVFCFALTESIRPINLDFMFRALPRVRDVTIELPGCEPYLSNQIMGCLRSLRLKKCISYGGNDILRFLEEQFKLGREIEEVEIEGCYSLRGNKGDL